MESWYGLVSLFFSYAWVFSLRSTGDDLYAIFSLNMCALCYAGILFFFLGNCLNFISFGYAAQVSYRSCIPTVLLICNDGVSFSRTLWKCFFPSFLLVVRFIFLYLLFFLCSHFLQPWDLFNLYQTLHLLTSCWTKWSLSSMWNEKWHKFWRL